jgi:hypothetical protein
MKNPKFNFTITGFIIAMIAISMFAGVFTSFLGGLTENYDLDVGAANDSLTTIQLTTYELVNGTSKEIRNQVDDIGSGNAFEQALDIIGAFFGGGWAAVKTSFESFNVFTGLMNNVSEDVEVFSFFKPYIMGIIIIALFVGVGIAVLLKMRI